MAISADDLRKVAEEGFYTAVGLGVTGALAAKRRLRTIPGIGSEVDAGFRLLEDAVLDGVAEVSRLVEQLFGEPRNEGHSA
jgi:hypothetical protein